jgi:prepilin-type N-terminal cleavage/methylation domain-containing protein
MTYGSKLIVHQMNRSAWSREGFTLIELIVVISLIAIMLFLSVPRFSYFFTSDDTSRTLRWLIVKIRFLKTSAVKDQKMYTLHADMDSGRLWISDESMETEEDKAAAMKQGLTLPDDVRLMDVEFPKTGRVPAGTVDIVFYKKGFSDRAIIHIEGSGDKMKSVVVEPFLSKVKVHDTYKSYDGDHI